ncbi:MAG: 50S ribosomal protein L7ae [Oscillospiraceae bacterium]|nr:50S ribosomal protein L7ae [Oscillospiraceae bacterium]
MEQRIDKTLGLLSIARKGGKLQLGEESVGALQAEKRARLTILASDAGAATVRRIRQQVEGTRQQVLVLPYDKQSLGAALGRQTVAVAAFTDVSLALAMVKTLQPETVDPELLRDLEQRVSRVKARRNSRR